MEKTVAEIINLTSESYIIYKNANELIKFRGGKLIYGDLFAEHEELYSQNDFVSKIKVAKLIVMMANIHNKKFLITILNEDEIYNSSWTQMKRLPKNSEMLFVYKGDLLTPQTLHKIDDLCSGINVQFVKYKALIFIWPYHDAMSKYTILNDEEKQVLQNMNINLHKLPKISMSENIIIWIGAKLGDIVFIDDMGTTSNAHYRIVLP